MKKMILPARGTELFVFPSDGDHLLSSSVQTFGYGSAVET